jgi:hypothetical protein
MRENWQGKAKEMKELQWENETFTDVLYHVPGSETLEAKTAVAVAVMIMGSAWFYLTCLPWRGTV